MLASNSIGLLNDFTKALGQQLYFWGCDVRHPQGNLLCEFGLERRKEQGVKEVVVTVCPTKATLLSYTGFVLDDIQNKTPVFCTLVSIKDVGSMQTLIHLCLDATTKN